jgi:glycosyltransferase involved in cell wall biosynthesis
LATVWGSPYVVKQQKRLVDVTVCEVVTAWAYPERQFTSRATVSVVIPTLNEACNIAEVLPRLPSGIDQVVLVDGGSTDGTVEVAVRLRPDLTVVQQTRRGKGNALACGFAAATGDIIVMMDADGSTRPEEIPQFVETLVRSGADFAKGSRFIPGGASHDITSFRRAGNKVLNLLVNRLCHTHYTDLCYGYNAFWRRCLPVLDLDHDNNQAISASVEMQWGDGFEIETLINIRAAGASLQVIEVPSVEHGRLSGRSNLRAFPDGFRVLRTIFVEWRRRLAPGTETQLNMATVLDFQAPHLGSEVLLAIGTEFQYSGVPDSNPRSGSPAQLSHRVEI